MESILNIFYISDDPTQAAQWMVDKHVVKMILESAQLLSTAHRLLDGRVTAGKSKLGRNVKRYILDDGREPVLYSATHVNHPSAVWARTSVENYLWLADHFSSLMDEYKVPGDSVESYRNYYRVGKSHMHSWKNRQPPEWISA